MFLYKLCKGHETGDDCLIHVSRYRAIPLDPFVRPPPEDDLKAFNEKISVGEDGVKTHQIKIGETMFEMREDAFAYDKEESEDGCLVSE